MDVDLRPVRKLRESAATRQALGPIIEAVCTSPADLATLRIVCDWIQYKQNFRPPVASRKIGAIGTEIAVDLRRCADIAPGDAEAEIKNALADPAGLPLEPWVPGRDSCIWRFNALYWQFLSEWEKATGRQYEQSLPGGESDARNTEAASELILELFRIWDELDARRALPDELYILELGVGNGSQARTWLDEFVQLDRRHGRDYYRRLRYLMGDYSPHVLERARRAVAHHAERISALVVDATRPGITLGFLNSKAFLVYISNVYDNLPTDELACIHGRTYQVQTQAYLTDDDADAIAAQSGTPRPALPKLIDRLLRIGPELLSESAPSHFPDTVAAVGFWRAVWEALKLKERYVPLEGLDSYPLTPDLTGEILRPLIEADGDVRMHVSNGALASLTGTLPLLHPFGRVQCHDLFLTGAQQYHTGFYGPGKYDGSVVNWVNGPLLQLVASRRGFGVQFAPFRQRPGSNITTLTAQARD
ncbi:MAG TPA: class I SAM-dependent methyltransferase [Streptosporangiaceae bacterium]|nr:class I SAM-dependent methyltransferase [Streptosporangiaceae bacterium]